MSKEHTGPTFVSSVLALIIGLLLGLTIRPARRHAPDAADPAPQPSSPAPRPAPAIDERRTPEIVGRQPSTARAARRGLKLPWRADLVVRGGIWTVSIFVIAVYALTSISRPGPSQVATGVESLSDGPVPFRAEGVDEDLPETQPQGPNPAEYILARWMDDLAAWRSVGLNPESTIDYEEEAAPLLLRIQNAVRGTRYTFNVRHDCAHRGSYEPIGSSDDGGGATPTLYEEGPGTSIADAALTTPDDGTFKLWGGSFASAAPGPSAVDLCLPTQGPKAEKDHAVALTAWSETVYLLWSGQTASHQD